MTAKDYLLSIGITRNNIESLHFRISDAHYDVADLMEGYAALKAAKPLRVENVTVIPFVAGMETGYLLEGIYYSKNRPVPRHLDRQPAVSTINGPVVVQSGDYLVMDVKGQVVKVINQATYHVEYAPAQGIDRSAIEVVNREGSYLVPIQPLTACQACGYANDERCQKHILYRSGDNPPRSICDHEYKRLRENPERT